MNPVVLQVLLFLAGLALLVMGGELLVRGASRLAGAFGLSPLVIGLTVVAFGTSAPELAVTLRAVRMGESGIAIGNVVGSNIANILLILGVSALFSPLAVNSQVIRLDVPLMVAASLGVYLLSLDGSIGRVDGALLLATLLAYTGFRAYRSRKEAGAVREQFEGAPRARPSERPWPFQLGLVVAGLLLLVLGARWLVSVAAGAAAALGVSPVVVGLTVVAVGTSLPELAASVIATRRGERDIAVGNAVGSNLFNILGALGLGALLAPGGIPISEGALRFDIPIMVAVAAACLPVFAHGHTILRWEGAFFLLHYAAYLAFLVLTALHSPALRTYSGVMATFVLPLAAVTLTVLSARAWRSHRREAKLARAPQPPQGA